MCVNVVYVIIIVQSNSSFLIHTYMHYTFPLVQLLHVCECSVYHNNCQVKQRLLDSYLCALHSPSITASTAAYIHTQTLCVYRGDLYQYALHLSPKGAPAATYIRTHTTRTPEQLACIHTQTSTDCNTHTHTPVHVTLGLQHGHCRSRCLPSCLFGLC